MDAFDRSYPSPDQVDPEMVKKAQEMLEKSIADHKSKLDRITAFEKDYEDLRELICDLPKKLKHDIMVPLGDLAFFPGHLHHTNEFLVLLGDNYFVQKSSSETAELIGRRLEYVSNERDGLEDSLDSMQKRYEMTQALFTNLPEGGFVDIREEYHSDDEAGPHPPEPATAVSSPPGNTPAGSSAHEAFSGRAGSVGGRVGVSSAVPGEDNSGSVKEKHVHWAGEEVLSPTSQSQTQTQTQPQPKTQQPISPAPKSSALTATTAAVTSASTAAATTTTTVSETAAQGSTAEVLVERGVVPDKVINERLRHLASLQSLIDSESDDESSDLCYDDDGGGDDDDDDDDAVGDDVGNINEEGVVGRDDRRNRGASVDGETEASTPSAPSAPSGGNFVMDTAGTSLHPHAQARTQPQASRTQLSQAHTQPPSSQPQPHLSQTQSSLKPARTIPGKIKPYPEDEAAPVPAIRSPSDIYQHMAQVSENSSRPQPSSAPLRHPQPFSQRVVERTPPSAGETMDLVNSPLPPAEPVAGGRRKPSLFKKQVNAAKESSR
eukprot:Rmarinus@m.23426